MHAMHKFTQSECLCQMGYKLMIMGIDAHVMLTFMQSECLGQMGYVDWNWCTWHAQVMIKCWSEYFLNDICHTLLLVDVDVEVNECIMLYTTLSCC